MDDFIMESRELVENYIMGKNKKLSKKHFFIFSISKYILLESMIIKKTDKNTLYFDNVKYSRFIPAMLLLANDIKGFGKITMNPCSINLEVESTDSDKLREAIWIIHKVRDSLCHPNLYNFDLDNNNLSINNDHSSDKNSFRLICKIPINFLNSVSFFFQSFSDKMTLSPDEYKRQMQDIIKDFDFEDNEFDDSFYLKQMLDTNKDSESISIIKSKQSSSLEYNNSKDYDTYNYYNKLIDLMKKLTNYKSLNSSNMESIRPLLITGNKVIEDKKLFTEQEVFSLIDEMSTIINSKNDSYIEVALYNYMQFVMSQKLGSIDYSHLCLKDIKIEYPTMSNYATSINEIEIRITNICKSFVNNIEKSIVNYERANDNSRKKITLSVNDMLVEFINNILKCLGNRNKIIVSSIRNAIDHGHFSMNTDGNIELFDQNDHNSTDIKIKFISSPKSLLEFTDKIVNPLYTYNDIISELKSVVDENTFNSVIETLINYSSVFLIGKSSNEVNNHASVK